MANLTPIEDRRRKSRTILLSALILLLLLWSIKLRYPQHTIIQFYGNHTITPEAPSLAHTTIPFLKPGGIDNVSGGRKWKSKPATTDALTSPVFNGTITKKVAVMVATGFRSNLIPLILHFSSVLGPSWPIIVYASVEDVGLFSTATALGRYILSGTVQIKTLPQTVFLSDEDSFSEFLTSKWIWEDLAPAEHVFLFRSDGMLCANAARSVEDYFEYDFVGAPAVDGKVVDYNGGLSLRKRSTILKVLEGWEWKEEKARNEKEKKKGVLFEDQWFFNHIKMLQERQEAEGILPSAEGAINLPTAEVARTFSEGNIDYPNPLGVHQVHRWVEKKVPELDEWCPEHRLCSTG
ncbi:hypothetical protein HYFRA_00001275 [Hymenoscyphus fraxineus]|uniref:DUF5672 domain-containing protein n=1 Tax=Hymenoscyphus fraxineus TaxID=746836 RepID=A0A9N9PZ58_9HELO|nr:hypothetical protein HYFRA_00001275 [Hymenoscyphus fraxineus]